MYFVCKGVADGSISSEKIKKIISTNIFLKKNYIQFHLRWLQTNIVKNANTILFFITPSCNTHGILNFAHKLNFRH